MFHKNITSMLNCELVARSNSWFRLIPDESNPAIAYIHDNMGHVVSAISEPAGQVPTVFIKTGHKLEISVANLAKNHMPGEIFHLLMVDDPKSAVKS